MRVAVSVGREQLGSLGVCFGKFTKTGKFTLHITALDYLAQYAKVRMNDNGCFFFFLMGWLSFYVSSTRSGLNPTVKCPFYTATMW